MARSILTLLLVLFITACAEDERPSYTDSSLYAFGDSLTDVGNAEIASSGLIPDNNYYKGRFSNGPLYIDHLANTLNTPIEPSRSFGTDYAFAGSKSIAVDAQVFNFKENVDASADSSALYVIWSGGNDLLELLQNSATDLTIVEAITHVKSAIQKLSAIGAKRILVINQIDMSYLPRVVALEQTS
ncbi:MAG: SGNH/GDSL hydrolase family protein, partial [Gammaproteobacteria bacterium]|nr:SGNH/GDSL hydrolase family protein [Gammaproteobacteria bacterium]